MRNDAPKTNFGQDSAQRRTLACVTGASHVLAGFGALIRP
jgi:hypothetical protein